MSKLESAMHSVFKFIQYLNDFFHQSHHAYLHKEQIFSLGYRCVIRWKYEWVDAPGETYPIHAVDIFKVKGATTCEKLSHAMGS
jgi:hypothetical protein